MKAVVVQDAAAKAAVIQDTSNAPASACKAMAFKDIQDLRRRREDSGSYNSDASEEGREDSNVRSDSSDDSYDQSEDESSATDDDDEEVISYAMNAATGLILSKTQRGSTIMHKYSKATQEFLDAAANAAQDATEKAAVVLEDWAAVEAAIADATVRRKMRGKKVNDFFASSS